MVEAIKQTFMQEYMQTTINDNFLLHLDYTTPAIELDKERLENRKKPFSVFG